MYTSFGLRSSIINQIHKRNSDVQLVVSSHDLKYPGKPNAVVQVKFLGMNCKKPDQSL